MLRGMQNSPFGKSSTFMQNHGKTFGEGNCKSSKNTHLGKDRVRLHNHDVTTCWQWQNATVEEVWQFELTVNGWNTASESLLRQTLKQNFNICTMLCQTKALAQSASLAPSNAASSCKRKQIPSVPCKCTWLPRNFPFIWCKTTKLLGQNSHEQSALNSKLKGTGILTCFALMWRNQGNEMGMC